MKILLTATAIAAALIFAPIAVPTALAVDAHHPGQAATTDQKKKPKPKPKAAVKPAQQSGLATGAVSVG